MEQFLISLAQIKQQLTGITAYSLSAIRIAETN